MTDEDFQLLINQITPLIKKQEIHSRPRISPKERLATTFRFLASGNSFVELSYMSRVSPQSMSSIVMEVCKALIQVSATKLWRSLNHIVSLCYHFIRLKVAERYLKIVWIITEPQEADLFTKASEKQKLEFLRNRLMTKSIKIMELD